MILNHRQRPWSEEEAVHVQHLLQDHGDARVEVVAYEDGYALRPVTASRKDEDPTASVEQPDSPDSIRLRPALRAHLGAALQVLLGGALLALAPRGPGWAADLPDIPDIVARFAWMEVAPLNVPLATVVLAVAGVVLLLRGAAHLLIGIFYYQYDLGPDRLVVQEGIIQRHRRSIDYRHARIPTLEQGVVERLLGVGSVRVSSAGSGDSGEIELRGIKRPQAVVEAIQQRMKGVRQ